jgi:hypothetical protein
VERSTIGSEHVRFTGVDPTAKYIAMVSRDEEYAIYGIAHAICPKDAPVEEITPAATVNTEHISQLFESPHPEDWSTYSTDSKPILTKAYTDSPRSYDLRPTSQRRIPLHS